MDTILWGLFSIFFGLVLWATSVLNTEEIKEINHCYAYDWISSMCLLYGVPCGKTEAKKCICFHTSEKDFKKLKKKGKL